MRTVMPNSPDDLLPAGTIRPEIPPLPRRLRGLPVSRGYAVPWFVAWLDGAPDFRVSDPVKWRRAIRERRCWICGEALGVHLAFVIGPMCGINRTTTEPPGHLECAIWSAQACPFLTRPHARRREVDAADAISPGGIPILRNPGVTLIWTTRTYRLFDDGHGKPLIEIGLPEAVRWYAEGRLATRAEVAYSVDTGYPALLEVAAGQDAETPGIGAVAELERRMRAFVACYPPEQSEEAPR